MTRFVSIEDFHVAGRPVTTDAHTRFEDGVAGDLAVGVRIEVEGLLNTAGVLVAREIEFDNRPPIGRQFGASEDIPGMPTGDWTPDRLSRASSSSVGGQTTITFEHGGRMEKGGVTYTCMSSAECRIEGTRVSMGTVLTSDTAGDLQIDTGEIRYGFPIVAAFGELSIRDSDLRPDLGDGDLPAETDTFVANPDGYFVTDGQLTQVTNQ